MANNKKVKRDFAENFEATEEDMVIEGYALKFESPATHDWTEIIDRHALDNCDMSDVVLRYNHNDTCESLARTRNGSLELEVDDIGLKIRATLIPTTWNKDLFLMIQRKLVTKMSFAFTISEDDWDYKENTRRILGIDKLFDVAVVDNPFYEDTEVYARDLAAYEKEKEEFINAKKLDLAKRKLKLKMEIMSK